MTGSIKFHFYILVLLVLFTKCSNIDKNIHVRNIDCEIFREIIIIPVLINNKEYLFQYDTGASTSISKKLAKELNLTIKDTVNAMDYYGNVSTMTTSTLPEISIGEITLKNIQICILRPIQGLQSCGVIIDGYLGNDLLPNSTIHIDIKNKVFQVSNSAKPFIQDKSLIGVDFIKNNGAPYIDIYFPGKNSSERVLFDTGSVNDLYRLNTIVFREMLKKGFLSPRNIIDTISSEYNGRGLFGKQNDNFNYIVAFDSIEIMGKKIVNYKTNTFSSPANHSILGAKILSLGAVTIDYLNNKMYFETYAREATDFSSKLGFKTNVNSDLKSIVTNVFAGSYAEKIGLKEGHQYIKINNTHFDSLSVCDKIIHDWNSEYNRDTIECVFLDFEDNEYVIRFILKK
ncbi:retroviral-like aspartic protease family protein [Wenyingzhuangia marina]|uniref:Aspartyl protease n=1 Tax=Wenyingzhuangia marina TaxID=1195760 RepID=A0A1M5V801_9FLAO|nr:aspartyl protease family protein [Wenyingzhuangia marina]GGF73860.1 hypothetical protein GCM10011397_15960 [Wenyingzhuangia marina]SHH71268.1 Aspartyl protease [Wenyingzhuangia marina]